MKIIPESSSKNISIKYFEQEMTKNDDDGVLGGFYTEQNYVLLSANKMKLNFKFNNAMRKISNSIQFIFCASSFSHHETLININTLSTSTKKIENLYVSPFFFSILLLIKTLISIILTNSALSPFLVHDKVLINFRLFD